ncbi:MAG: hypothetical protein GY870_15575 [archaeon]|nr:hypothetical protein [archaeon]
MVENQRVSPNNKIKRALLPLVISMTFGIFIYQGLGPNGILFALFGPNTVNWIDHPLTHPGTLGVMTAAMSSPNELYFEIGYFARYCISPMIITFILLSLLIPGAWLLDDAGVCFYEKPLADRMVSDVERVSKWTLSKTTGLFGFTGGVSFFSLFLPMLLNLDDLIYYLGILSEGENVIFGIYVLLLALIVFPILAGILLMYGAMLRMEEDLDKNRSKLYKRLKKNEIDTDPLDLSVFLDAKEKKNKDIFEVKRGL